MTNISVKVDSLSLKFGSHTALCNVSFQIEEGSFITVVGPNGGGKSTLLKAILGLIQVYSGSISIFGQEPQSVKRTDIGYVPQIKTLDRSFPALPIELVATGILGFWPQKINKELKEKSMLALEKVGASHLSERPLSKLSGGELQRIYLARSIARHPKLLILDEPATGIDFASENDLNRLIDKYKIENNATIIMVTHDWEAAFHHADFVLMLNCTQICYAPPKIAFEEKTLRRAFGHIGHEHEMIFGVKQND